MDFIPDVHVGSLKTILSHDKHQFAVNYGSSTYCKNFVDFMCLQEQNFLFCLKVGTWNV